MIELRWVERQEKVFHELDGWYTLDVTVLQYRQEEVNMLGNWTDWQDVPTVEDDTGQGKE